MAGALAGCVVTGLAWGDARGAKGPRSNVIQFETFVPNDRGRVRCGLFDAEGWLEAPLQTSVARIRSKRAICVFRRVPNGTYALSAFHDENDNGELDRNFLGMPAEAYCTSRGARGTLGPPRFADARFRYAGGMVRLSARMR